LNTISTETLFLILIILLFVSAYFSSSETALMSLNRYRLRHLVKQKHRGALRAAELLHNPERLIGVILIGNNFVNILASSIATIIAIRLAGDAGVIVATVLLTIAILIFSEVTPKTIAALYPEQIAFPSARILHYLLILLRPLVNLVSAISRNLLGLLGISTEGNGDIHLSTEELRTVVDEASPKIPKQRQHMLLNVLDLEKVTVNDIMIPRSEVTGIDLEDDMRDILDTLNNAVHTRLPVYKGDVNQIVGILHIRNATRVLLDDEPNKAMLVQETREPYFVPESTPLTTQLLEFQKQKRRIALVVDEYGDVKGLITLDDILEEIVGSFTTNVSEETAEIHPQEDGTYLIDGGAHIRDINRTLNWNLSTDGPKTLSGLLTEELELIPDSSLSLIIADAYYAEILSMQDNLIKTVKMWPKVIQQEVNQEVSDEAQAALSD
jgi:Mg2+/Co2+ transporter CorB